MSSLTFVTVVIASVITSVIVCAESRKFRDTKPNSKPLKTICPTGQFYSTTFEACRNCTVCYREFEARKCGTFHDASCLSIIKSWQKKNSRRISQPRVNAYFVTQNVVSTESEVVTAVTDEQTESDLHEESFVVLIVIALLALGVFVFVVVLGAVILRRRRRESKLAASGHLKDNLYTVWPIYKPSAKARLNPTNASRHLPPQDNTSRVGCLYPSRSAVPLITPDPEADTRQTYVYMQKVGLTKDAGQETGLYVSREEIGSRGI